MTSPPSISTSIPQYWMLPTTASWPSSRCAATTRRADSSASKAPRTSGVQGRQRPAEGEVPKNTGTQVWDAPFPGPLSSALGES